MNRREMFQAGIAAISASGLVGEVKPLDAESPIAIAVTFKSPLSKAQVERIRAEWKRHFESTSLASVPVVILPDGADVRLVDRRVEYYQQMHAAGFMSVNDIRRAEGLPPVESQT